ncbi:TonB-dependent receptor [Sphingobium sp. CFD-2]|uniref:TonB-dependent receptor n=1 Tax=Sphingobium sp. CFD-2 TaxID=2878542 RepID=UPI00214C62A3|nr:TonB-dependent receptor [Sphingobium sp. CFD-2]
MKIGTRALIGASISALALAGQAHAQQVSAPAETTAAPTSSEADIVVTANKREQKLNDVGLTVAVVSGAALKNQQINSLSDLANVTPSLSFTNSANGTPVYTLRGVGFYEVSLGAYPTVSTYLDEVPLSFPVLSSHSAFDLERVEVLKGPQGTLFGQNATGGAINYIAAKPTNTLKAGANLSYGRFNEVVAEAYISGPLSDTLKARLSGKLEHADGWQQSNSRPGDTNGKVRNYMGRLLVDFAPTDTFRMLLNVNGWKDKSDTQAPQYVGLQPQQVFLDPDTAAAQFSPEKPRAADWTPGLPYRDNSMWQASLRAELDITDTITLTSLSSYADYKQNQRDDGDGLPTLGLDLVGDRGRIKSFNQELRLSNGGGAGLRWVVGANYEHSKVDQFIDQNLDDSSSSETYGIALGYPFFSVSYSTRQKMENYAFFGNVEYDISDQLTFKVGARYTNASTKANICSNDPSGNPRNTGALFYDVLLGGRLGPYAGQCFVINNLPRTVDGVAPGDPGAFVDELKQDNISWRAGIDYKPAPGILLYANVAKGYKGGGYPVVSASFFNQYLPVTQESVQSYEAGFKATLFDRVLQLNGAAFYYDYKDKQLRSKLLDANFGILDVLQNIPKSSVKGFELEANLRPVSGLTINSAFTFIDAKIDEFSGINAAGVAANFKGARVPYTPKYQLGVNADYDFPVSGSLNAFVGAGVNWRSDTVAVIGGDINPTNATPQDKKLFGIAAYTLVDLRAGIHSSDDRWRVSVWGKNIFNEYYWNNVVAATDTIGRYAGKPATYGVSLSYQY